MGNPKDKHERFFAQAKRQLEVDAQEWLEAMKKGEVQSRDQAPPILFSEKAQWSEAEALAWLCIGDLKWLDGHSRTLGSLGADARDVAVIVAYADSDGLAARMPIERATELLRQHRDDWRLGDGYSRKKIESDCPYCPTERTKRDHALIKQFNSWYRDSWVGNGVWRSWLDSHDKKSAHNPSEDDDLQAGRECVAPSITRDMMREARKNFAPAPWKIAGRRAG